MNHIRRANFENQISRNEIEIMCENKYAFPLLCKLVSNSEERFKKRIAFFGQPLSLLREELDKMSDDNKKLYCILVMCMLNKGSFNSNIFDIYSNECDKKINRIMQTCGLQRNMSKKELEDSARSAVGSYFTKDSDNFRFIHDALEETVGCHFYMFDKKAKIGERENKDAISQVIEATDSRRTLIYWIVAFGCYEFFQYAWSKMTTLERKWILGRDYFSNPLVKSLFPLAVLGGSFHILEELVSSGADWALLVRNGAHVNLQELFTIDIPNNVASKKVELTSSILENDLHKTLLHEAVRNNDFNRLISNIRSENIDFKTKNGWTVLHYAVLLNNLQAVNVLLSEDFTQKNDSYVQPLTQIAQRKLYRKPTPKVSITDNNGLTAVHLAVMNNYCDILSVLLRNKAEVKVRDDFDRTPLHYTTSGIATKMLVTHSIRKQCLENAPLIEEGREYDKTPMSVFKTFSLNITLHTALRNISRDFVNMPDKEGNTPLHSVGERCILTKESSGCIKTLIYNGANPF
ncbi:unnamed protein product [Mytilus edulis]|uniref:Uncharacterized protein n=1 Tax=Mytilus edulis TaxID=6550 RepID=A0A8S3QV58_MYTED|nr:unnamed protein product [Mytilus edulis]